MGSRSEYESTEYHGGRNEGIERQDWWRCEKDNVHHNLFATVEEINGQNGLYVEQIKNARMYTNQDIMSASPEMSSNTAGVLPKNRPTYNLVKSSIDTLNSRIGKSKPRPYFLTTKGDYEKQEKAKKLQQFMDGFFDKEHIYIKSKNIFRDSCIFKLGVFKLWVKDGDLKIDHINPMEISVDEVDGRYGDPSCIYQTKFIKTTVLEARYPKYKEQIKSSAKEQVSTKTMVCKVIEGFKKGPNGRHVISIEEATLSDNPYTKDYFPYEFFRYEDALIGFWGEDVVNQEAGIQLEINKVMRMISKGIELVAVPKVFMTATASVPEVAINNRIGQVIKHAAGQPPTFYTPTAMTPEVYKYLDWLIQTGFELLGLSKMSATAEKPAGLSSGKALRTYQDIESDRFAITAQRWDSFFLRLCDKIISEAKEVYSKVKVPVVGAKFLETIDWSEISMEKDEYVMRVFSTNLLPTQPPAKLEMVRELTEMGAINPDRTLELMDMPDIEQYIDQRNGTSNLVKYQVDQILTKGNYIAPDPKINPTLGYEIANDRFLDLLSKENVSQEKVELLSRYVEQIEGMMQPPQGLEPVSPDGGQLTPEPQMQGGPEMGALSALESGQLPAELAAMGGGAIPPSPEEIAMLGQNVPI